MAGTNEATILGQFAAHGVDVNGLIVPGRLAESALARHAFNLMVNNDDEAFKLYLRGSASAIRYKGRELLLTTQHQLKGVDETQVAMLTDNGSHIAQFLEIRLLDCEYPARNENGDGGHGLEHLDESHRQVEIGLVRADETCTEECPFESVSLRCSEGEGTTN